MLYPNFKDLIALKDRKIKLRYNAQRSVKSTFSGSHGSPFRGQGLEFDAVREYVPGDDIRNIDWRVTARTGSPHLKLFKEEKERTVILCVDSNASMRFGTRKTFKSIQAAHAAALLGWQAVNTHDRVSACLYGDVTEGIQFFSSAKSSIALCQMLKTLCETPKQSHSTSINTIFSPIEQSAQTGALIYFISDFMDIDPTMINSGVINKLCKRCNVVFIAINDPLDQSLPSVGVLEFYQKEMKLSVDTGSKTGRKPYEEQWVRNRESLYHLTSKFRIPLIELTTESDISQDLPFALKMQSKRNYR